MNTLELLPGETVVEERAGVIVTNRRVVSSFKGGWVLRRSVRVWIPVENIDAVEAGVRSMPALLVFAVIAFITCVAIGVANHGGEVVGIVLGTLIGLGLVLAFFASRRSGIVIKSASTVLPVALRSPLDIDDFLTMLDKVRNGRLLALQTRAGQDQPP